MLELYKLTTAVRGVTEQAAAIIAARKVRCAWVLCAWSAETSRESRVEP
jgi:hypothetical protein